MNKSAFDNIQGYSEIVDKLKIISDFFKNPEAATSIGVPTKSYAMVFSGQAVYEKESIISSFIEDCGIKTITIEASLKKTLKETVTNSILSVKDTAPIIFYLKEIDKYVYENDYKFLKDAFANIADKQIYVIATELDKNPFIDCYFDANFEVDYPSPMESVMIARCELQKYKLGINVNIDKISRIFNDYTSTGIRNTIKRAAIIAASKGCNVINNEDLYYARFDVNEELIDRYVNNIGMPGIIMAVYEAGKALITEWLYPNSVQGLSIVDASIPPKYKGILLSDYYDEDANGVNGKRRQLMIVLAGRIACELALEEEYSTKFDLRECSTISKAIIDECGAGDIVLGTGYDWNNNASSSRKRAMEQAQEKEIQRCYNKVTQYLKENVDLLNIVGGELIEKGILTWEDFSKLKLEYWSKSFKPDILFDLCEGEDSYSLKAYIIDGELHLEGQDLGPSIESIYGKDEYEYFHTFSKEDTIKLKELLSFDSLISALKGFFHGERKTAEFYDFCEKNHIKYGTKVI